MFCKNCGKDIGDAKFCQYCGFCNDNTPKSSGSVEFLKAAEEKIIKFGHNKVINIISGLFLIISLIIRIVNNEIDIVYVLFAQDDYYVISEGGRTAVIVLIAIQVISSVLLYIHARYKRISVSIGVVAFFLISVVIQILMISIRLPAPY